MTVNIFLFISIVFIYSCSEKSISTNTIKSTPMVIKEDLVKRSGKVKYGQGLFQALKSVNIENNTALAIINALRDEVEFSKLKVGDELTAYFNQTNKLVKFSFSQNPAQFHIVNWDQNNNTWNYVFEEKETKWVKKLISGSLKADSTLQQDLLSKDLSPGLVNQIVSILMCKVNFRMNARVGDEYQVLIDERKFNDETIETKIYYTSYNGKKAGSHEAFFYEDDEKKSTYSAHYTIDGQALIRSGLRYPLSSLHIRSGFGWRRHPVTGHRKMHRGIDLRGKIGRPVHAVADGKVIQSSYNPIAGNKIAIKHRDGSVSYYLHLNKRSVNKGTWVKSYQVIGTVGKTGRVTGAHLHFGFKQSNGKWINPLNKRMIATPKLKGEKLASLKNQVLQIKGMLADIKIKSNAPYIASKQNREKEGDFLEGLWSI